MAWKRKNKEAKVLQEKKAVRATEKEEMGNVMSSCRRKG